MTRGSIREYAEAVRGHYFQVSKKEKGKPRYFLKVLSQRVGGKSWFWVC